MDVGEDTSYLTLLNDGENNYLIESADQSLGFQDHSLNETATFDSVDNRVWPDPASALINSDMVLGEAELETPINLVQDNIELSITDASLYNFCETSLNGGNVLPVANAAKENGIDYSIEVPNKSYPVNNALFISNGLLLHLNNKINNRDTKNTKDNSKISNKIIDSRLILPTNDKTLINLKSLVLVSDVAGKTPNDLDSTSKQHSPNKNNLNGKTSISSLNLTKSFVSNQTLLNVDKNILNYNASLKQFLDPKIHSVESTMTIKTSNERYTLVSAYKCQDCKYICEDQDGMHAHWQSLHSLLKSTNSLKKSTDTEFSQQQLSYTSDNSGEFETITKSNINQTIYLCSECNNGYSSIEKLKNHMVLEHKLLGEFEIVSETSATQEDNISTPKQSVSKQKTVALLQKQSRASKKIKCSIRGCDLRFAKNEMRIRHEKCHVEGNKKQFICYECNRKFSIWRVCSMHMWKCHKVDLGLFTCQMCSVFKTSSPARIASHMLIHNDEKPYACLQCSKSFKKQSHLQNHQLTHIQQGEDVPLWATQQQCHICKKFFANTKSLKKHIISVHDKFKPFVCSICGHKTTRKAMLVLHLRQHTGEKPHKCNICNYRTGDHNSLRRHIMRHSGEVKYSCPHCSYQSIQSTSYKNHVASKHPGLGGSYFCSLCSFHTVNEISYSNHVADHKNGLIKESNKEESKLNSILTSPQCINDTQVTEVSKTSEDDESPNYLLMLDHSSEAIDTGGITIPANLDSSL